MSIVQQVARAWKKLSRRERAWLSDESMRASDANWRVRCKIVRNLARGNAPQEIASILDCGRSHVYRVARRFLDDGPAGLVDRREDNGEAKVSDDYEWHVLVAVYVSPQQYGYQRPTWTQELLILAAEKETGVSISVTTMSRLLARHGVRHGRPKPMVACPWSKHKKTRRLNEIRRLRERLPRDEVLLFVDEVDIHLNPKIGDDWMLPGQQKTVLTPGKNEKQYLAGALNDRSGRISYIAGPRKTSALFVALVDHLVRRAYAWTRTIHLVLDNFRIHASRAVEAARARWGNRVQLHFLPPYCPDENRIERLWKDLHDNVTRNHICRSMHELMQRVHDYLDVRRRTGRHRYITTT
jgi:transposase